jgi:hypothetical protein
MKVYLAKFVKNKRIAYKIGHTKWFKSIKRFDDEEYDVFDDVIILDDIYIEHKDARIARLCSELVEASLQGVFPKGFRLEDHFITEANTFNGFSGITEFFLLEEGVSEDKLVNIFSRVKTRVNLIVRKYNG